MNLDKLQALVFDNTSEIYAVEWVFNSTKTKEINMNPDFEKTKPKVFEKMKDFSSTNYTYFDINPIISNPKNSEIMLKNKYFLEDFLYVFYLNITGSPKYFDYNITITKEFIFEIESGPNCRFARVNPRVGISMITNFIVTCDCIDDVSNSTEINKTISINYINRLSPDFNSSLIPDDMFGYTGQGLYSDNEKIINNIVGNSTNSSNNVSNEYVIKIRGREESDVTYYNITCQAIDKSGLISLKNQIVKVLKNSVANNDESIKSMFLKKHLHSEINENGDEEYYYLNKENAVLNKTDPNFSYRNNINITISRYPMIFDFTNTDQLSNYRLTQVLYSLSQNTIVSETELPNTILEYKNYTSFTSELELVTVNDVKCDNNYCNNKGNCVIVSTYITCICENNYYGSFCHLDLDSLNILKSLATNLLDKVESTILPTNRLDFSYVIASFRNLICSGSYIFGTEDLTYFERSMNVMTILFKNGYLTEEYLHTILAMNDCFISYGYFNVLPSLYLDSVDSSDTLRRLQVKNSQIIDVKTRNATLDEFNYQKFRPIFYSIRNSLKNIVDKLVNIYNSLPLSNYKYRSNINKYFKIENENIILASPNSESKYFEGFTQTKLLDSIDFYITRLDETFRALDFFKENKQNYMPYFDDQDCFKNLPKEKSKYYFIFLIYKHNPYIYSPLITSTIVSNIIRFEIFDLETRKKVDVSSCNNGVFTNYTNFTTTEIINGTNSTNNVTNKGNYLKQFYPVRHIYLPNTINYWRNLMDPEKQQTNFSDLFTEPVLVDSNGKVEEIILNGNIENLYVPVNFTCSYLLENFDSYDNEGLIYSNYTNENYFECDDFRNDRSEYTVQFYYNIRKFNFTSRFIFLKKLAIFKYGANYNNYALYYYSIFFGLYLVVIYLFLGFNYKGVSAYVLLSRKKDFIISKNLPYLHDFKQFERPNSGGVFEENIDANEVGKGNLNYDKEVVKTLYSIEDENQQGYINNKSKAENEIINSQVKISKNSPNRLNDNQLHSRNKKTIYLNDIGKNEVIKVGRPTDLGDNANNSNNNINNNNNQQNDNSNNVSNLVSGNLLVLNENNNQYRNFVNDDLFNDQEVNNLGGHMMNNYLEDAKINGKKVVTIFDKNSLRNMDYIDNKDIISKEFNDMIDNKYDLYPDLERVLNTEVEQDEFLKLNQLSYFEFFKRNLWNRHLFLSGFVQKPIVYDRFIKIMNFITYFALCSLFISIFLTMNAKYYFSNPDFNFKYIGIGILAAIVSLLLAAILSYPINLMFYVNNQFFRDAYFIIKEAPGMKLESHWEKLNNRKLKYFVGVTLQLFFTILSLVISFMFCACYKYQQLPWIILNVIALCIDLLIMEVLIELFVTFVFYLNVEKEDCIKVTKLNTWRNYRCLV